MRAPREHRRSLWVAEEPSGGAPLSGSPHLRALHPHTQSVVRQTQRFKTLAQGRQLASNMESGTHTLAPASPRSAHTTSTYLDGSRRRRRAASPPSPRCPFAAKLPKNHARAPTVANGLMRGVQNKGRGAKRVIGHFSGAATSSPLRRPSCGSLAAAKERSHLTSFELFARYNQGTIQNIDQECGRRKDYNATTTPALPSTRATAAARGLCGVCGDDGARLVQ